MCGPFSFFHFGILCLVNFLFVCLEEGKNIKLDGVNREVRKF